MPKFTNKPLVANTIDAIKPGRDRQEFHDAAMRGLSFIVQPTGTRTWAFRFRHNGQRRKIVLGTYPELSLANARTRAGEVIADPDKALQVKPDAADADLVADVWTRYVALHLNNRELVRESSAKRFQQLFESTILPKWKGRRIGEVGKREVVEVLDAAQARGISARNSTRTVLSSFFNWAAGRALIEDSPLAGVKKLEERSRDRVLSDAELKTIWHGCERMGFVFGPMFQLLMLTGARRDEIASLEWSEVDTESRYITIPKERTKTDSEHAIYLNDEALAIIEKLPRLADCKFVFSTTGDSPSSGFSKAKALLDKIAPTAKPWRLHDLRRTFSTGLVPLGVSEITIEKCLNHTLKGPLGVYNRHDYAAEKKRAWEAWGDHVAGLVNAESNVVTLQPKIPA